MIDDILRLGGAIVLETLALVVWNVGTRSPLGVLRDIRRASRNGHAIVAGTVSLLVGIIFVAAATVLVLPAIGDLTSDFVPIEIFTFLAALLAEHLIGNDLRRLTSGR